MYAGEPCLICDPFVLAQFPFTRSFESALARIWFGSSPAPNTSPFFKLLSFPLLVLSRLCALARIQCPISRTSRALKRVLPFFCLQHFTVSTVTLSTFARTLSGGC